MELQPAENHTSRLQTLRSLFAFSLLALTLALPYYYSEWTDHFRLEKCRLSYPYVAKWESEPADEQIRTLLERPFYYAGGGKQMFAFFSDDGQTVLKLFHFNKLKVPFRPRDLFFPKIPPLHERAYLSFNSCKIAEQRAKDLTGILFLHLNPKKGNLPEITIFDKLGRKHCIDPASYRFLLQKRIVPLEAAFLQNSNHPAMIDSFQKFIDELAALGLAKDRGKFAPNYGFLDGKPMMIDFANLMHSGSNPTYLKSKFAKWLSSREVEKQD